MTKACLAEHNVKYVTLLSYAKFLNEYLYKNKETQIESMTYIFGYNMASKADGLIRKACGIIIFVYLYYPFIHIEFHRE